MPTKWAKGRIEQFLERFCAALTPFNASYSVEEQYNISHASDLLLCLS
jgi:hypothetical protein